MAEELWSGLALFVVITIIGYIKQRHSALTKLYNADGGEDIRQAINGKYKVRFVGWLSCFIGGLLYCFLAYAMFSEIGNRFFTYVLCFLFLLPCSVIAGFIYAMYGFVVHDLDNRIKGR